MKMKLILICILLLVVFLQMRNTEGFTDDSFKLVKKEENCRVNTEILNDVNKFQKQTCKESKNLNSSETSQNRLTCRDFETKKIYLDVDQRSWCDGIDTPKLVNSNMEGNYDGIGKLEVTGPGPLPLSNKDLTASEFPFNLNMVEKEFTDVNNKKND